MYSTSNTDRDTEALLKLITALSHATTAAAAALETGLFNVPVNASMCTKVTLEVSLGAVRHAMISASDKGIVEKYVIHNQADQLAMDEEKGNNNE